MEMPIEFPAWCRPLNSRTGRVSEGRHIRDTQLHTRNTMTTKIIIRGPFQRDRHTPYLSKPRGLEVHVKQVLHVCHVSYMGDTQIRAKNIRTPPSVQQKLPQ